MTGPTPPREGVKTSTVVQDYRLAREAQDARFNAREGAGGVDASMTGTEEYRSYFGQDGEADGVEERVTFKSHLQQQGAESRAARQYAGVKEQVEIDPAVARIMTEVREYVPLPDPVPEVYVEPEVIELDAFASVDEVVDAFAAPAQEAFAESVEDAFAAPVMDAFAAPQRDAFANGVFDALPDLFTDVQALGLFSGGVPSSLFGEAVWGSSFELGESFTGLYQVEYGEPLEPVTYLVPPPPMRPLPVKGFHLPLEEFWESFPRAKPSLYKVGQSLDFNMAMRNRGLECVVNDPCEWWEEYGPEVERIEGDGVCLKHPLLAEPFTDLKQTMALPSVDGLSGAGQKLWVEAVPIMRRLREKALADVERLAMVPHKYLDYLVTASGWRPEPGSTTGYRDIREAIVKNAKLFPELGIGALWADLMVQFYNTAIDVDDPEDGREVNRLLGHIYQLEVLPDYPLQILVINTFHPPGEFTDDDLQLFGDYRIWTSVYRSMLCAKDYNPRIGSGEFGWLLHFVAPVDHRGNEVTIVGKPAT